MFSPMQEDYDGYHRRRYPQQVPAFGSWDCFQDVDDLSRCFEAARQAGYIRYAADRDLYVAGDLYEDHVITPTMIVVPRPVGKVVVDDDDDEKEKKSWTKVEEEDGDGDVYDEMEGEFMGMTRKNPKPVDEDLYKISPQLLHSMNSKHYRKNNKKNNKKKKKNGVVGFLTCCLMPCAS